MKGDVKSVAQREKEALEWVKDFFANNAARLKPRAISTVLLEDTVPVLTSGLNADGYFRDLARDGGDPIIHRHLCLMAAFLLERGDQLPRDLRGFVIELLRNPNKKIKPWARSNTLLERDKLIADAIIFITNKWKISATRNPATERASAASIVRKALKIAAGLPLKEKAVNTIWEGPNAKIERDEFTKASRFLLKMNIIAIRMSPRMSCWRISGT
jgi:hypothetical protein